MTYFNTTNESGATLKNNVAKAKSQEKEILNIFLDDIIRMETIYFISDKDTNEYKGYTPSQMTFYFDYPITSIRRALTNLTKQGKLIKTDEKRIGMYGRSEYVWKLNEN